MRLQEREGKRDRGCSMKNFSKEENERKEK